MATVLQVSQYEVVRLLQQRDTEFGRRHAQGLGGIESWPAYWGVIDLFFTERRMKLEVLLELLITAGIAEADHDGGIHHVLGRFNKWLVKPYSRWVYQDDTQQTNPALTTESVQNCRMQQLPCILVAAMQADQQPVLEKPKCQHANSRYTCFMCIEKEHLATALFWVHYQANPQGWMEPEEQAGEALPLFELLYNTCQNDPDSSVRHMVVPCILMAMLSILLSGFFSDVSERDNVWRKLEPFRQKLDQHIDQLPQHGRNDRKDRSEDTGSSGPPEEGVMYTPTLDDCVSILNLALGLFQLNCGEATRNEEQTKKGKRRIHLAVGDDFEPPPTGTRNWQHAIRSLSMLVSYSPALWSDWQEPFFQASSRFMKGIVSTLLRELMMSAVSTTGRGLVYDWSQRWLALEVSVVPEAVLGSQASSTLWNWQRTGRPEPLLDLMSVLAELYKNCGEDCFEDRQAFWAPQSFFWQLTSMSVDLLEWHNFYNEAHFRLMAAAAGVDRPEGVDSVDCATLAFQVLYQEQETVSNTLHYLFNALGSITEQLKTGALAKIDLWEENVFLAGFQVVNKLICTDDCEPHQEAEFISRRDVLFEHGVFNYLLDLVGSCSSFLRVPFKAAVFELLGSFADSKDQAEIIWRHFDQFHPVPATTQGLGAEENVFALREYGANTSHGADHDGLLSDLQMDAQNPDITQRGCFGRMFVRLLHKLLCAGVPSGTVGLSVWRYVERIFCTGRWGGMIHSLRLRTDYAKRAEMWTSVEPIVKIFRKLLTDLDVEDLSSPEPRQSTLVANRLMDELTGGIRPHGSAGQYSLFQQLCLLLQDGLVAVGYEDEIFESHFDVDTYRSQKQCTEDCLHVILLLLQKGSQWAEAAGNTLGYTMRFNKVEELLCDGSGIRLSTVMQYIGQFRPRNSGATPGFNEAAHHDANVCTAPHHSEHAHVALEILNIVQRLVPDITTIPAVIDNVTLHVQNFMYRLEEALYDYTEMDDTSLLQSLQQRELGELHPHTSVAIIQLLCISLEQRAHRETFAHMVLGFDLERLSTSSDAAYPSPHLMQHGVQLGLKKMIDQLQDQNLVTLFPIYSCECLRLLYLLSAHKLSYHTTLKELCRSTETHGPLLQQLLESQWLANKVAGSSSAPSMPGVLRVLSIDSPVGEAEYGKYFHFERIDVPELPPGGEIKVMLVNTRTGKKGLAMLYGYSNGGSVGDAYGRFHPVQSAHAKQHEVGDTLTYEVPGGPETWGQLRLARAYLLKTVALAIRVGLKLRQQWWKELVNALFLTTSNAPGDFRSMPLVLWLLQQMDMAEPPGRPQRLDSRARRSGMGSSAFSATEARSYQESAEFLIPLRSGEQRYDVKGLVAWLAMNRDIPPEVKKEMVQQAAKYNKDRRVYEAELTIKLLLFEGWAQVLEVCLVDHREHRAVRGYLLNRAEDSPSTQAAVAQDTHAQAMLFEILGGEMQGGLLGKLTAASPSQAEAVVASCLRAPISRSVLVAFSALRWLTYGSELPSTLASQTLSIDKCKSAMKALIGCVTQRGTTVNSDELAPTPGGVVRTMSCTPHQLARRNTYASLIVFFEMMSDAHMPFLRLCDYVQYPLAELQQVRAARGHLHRELQQALGSRLRDFLTSLLYDIFHENDLKLQMLAAQAASSVISEPQLVPVLLQCCPGMSQQLLGGLAHHAGFITNELLKEIPDSPELIMVHSSVVQMLTAVARTREGAAALLDERITVELGKLSFLYHVHGADDGGHQQSVLPVRTRFTSLLRPVLELVAELISHEQTKGTSYRAVLELLTVYKDTIESVLSATASRHVQAEELVDILSELQLATLIMRLLAESNSGVLHGMHQLDAKGELQAMARITRDRMHRLLDDMLSAVSRGSNGHEVRTVLGDCIKNQILKEPNASESRDHAAVFNLEETGGIQYTQRQLTLKICSNVLRYFEAISSVSKGAQLKMDVQLFYRDQNPTSTGAQPAQSGHNGAPDMSRAKDLIKLAEAFYNEAQEVATAESIIRSQGIQARFPLREQLDKQKRCRDSMGALVMCIEMSLQVMLRLLENDDSLVEPVASSLGSTGLQGAPMHGDMRANRRLHLIELRRHCEDFIDSCCQTTSAYPAQSAPRLTGSKAPSDCAPALNSDFLLNMRHQLHNYFESKDIRPRNDQDSLSKYAPRSLPGRVAPAALMN
eukprot:TRINITY_DN16023_c0_g1_i1.p1 TRINITY_DN16023_c0_g1~~TRINITY_DN16023_c0_g1_i1.p1  ORF type:complete len:2166 (+),score=542.92 TRINITY_DN16023_c0_g1_i1:101-6598(+)